MSAKADVSGDVNVGVSASAASHLSICILPSLNSCTCCKKWRIDESLLDMLNDLSSKEQLPSRLMNAIAS